MYPEYETKVSDDILGFLILIMGISFLVAILFMLTDTSYKQGTMENKNMTMQRAIEEGVVWYDKKGNLVYSGNMQYVLTGEKE
jgi:hypothetical protein